jgi:hypothetical protein
LVNATRTNQWSGYGEPIMKKIAKLLVISLLSSLATVANAANDDFGRLFSRPNERATLDNMRQNQQLKAVNPKENAPAEGDAENAAPTALPDPITLQGYVKRSDGSKSTLWINGQAVQEGSTVDNLQIGKLNKQGFSKKGASTEGINVKIPGNGKQVRLKAGQMYEPENDQIVEMQVVEKAKLLNLEETGVIDDSPITPSKAGNRAE